MQATEILYDEPLERDDGEIDIPVTSYHIYLSEDLVDGWYDSCDGVILPSVQDYAVNQMCNPPQGQSCDPYYWLLYQGQNALAPVNIDYTIVAAPEKLPKYSTTISWDQWKEYPTADKDFANGTLLPHPLEDPEGSYDWMKDSEFPRITTMGYCYK